MRTNTEKHAYVQDPHIYYLHTCIQTFIKSTHLDKEGPACDVNDFFSVHDVIIYAVPTALVLIFATVRKHNFVALFLQTTDHAHELHNRPVQCMLMPNDSAERKS